MVECMARIPEDGGSNPGPEPEFFSCNFDDLDQNLRCYGSYEVFQVLSKLVCPRISFWAKVGMLEMSKSTIFADFVVN